MLVEVKIPRTILPMPEAGVDSAAEHEVDLSLPPSPEKFLPIRRAGADRNPRLTSAVGRVLEALAVVSADRAAVVVLVVSPADRAVVALAVVVASAAADSAEEIQRKGLPPRNLKRRKAISKALLEKEILVDLNLSEVDPIDPKIKGDLNRKVFPSSLNRKRQHRVRRSRRIGAQPLQKHSPHRALRADLAKRLLRIGVRPGHLRIVPVNEVQPRPDFVAVPAARKQRTVLRHMVLDGKPTQITGVNPHIVDTGMPLIGAVLDGQRTGTKPLIVDMDMQPTGVMLLMVDVGTPGIGADSTPLAGSHTLVTGGKAIMATDRSAITAGRADMHNMVADMLHLVGTVMRWATRHSARMGTA